MEKRAPKPDPISSIPCDEGGKRHIKGCPHNKASQELLDYRAAHEKVCQTCEGCWGKCAFTSGYHLGRKEEKEATQTSTTIPEWSGMTTWTTREADCPEIALQPIVR